MEQLSFLLLKLFFITPTINALSTGNKIMQELQPHKYIATKTVTYIEIVSTKGTTTQET